MYNLLVRYTAWNREGRDIIDLGRVFGWRLKFGVIAVGAQVREGHVKQLV